MSLYPAGSGWRKPRFQLYSMNLTIAVWLASVLSTKLGFAYGEITSMGMRGP